MDMQQMVAFSTTNFYTRSPDYNILSSAAGQKVNALLVSQYHPFVKDSRGSIKRTLTVQ